MVTLILITYLAGALTILSPCILPVLPFVFSTAHRSFLKGGLPLLVGMSFTFSLFSVFAIAGGEWIARASEIGRYLAMALMTFFALSLIFPEISEKVLTPLTRLGSKIGSNDQKENIWSSFLIGVSTGLLWAPCAGPILGLVLTGAASQGKTSQAIGLLVSYSLGAATSLALALVAGHRFLGRMKKFLGFDRIVKRTLGIAVLLGVVVIGFHLDRTVLTQISKVKTANLENRLLSVAGLNQEEKTPGTNQGQMPEFAGGTTWLNSSPLTRKDLLGKVVLIDFWTYSCINCIRTLPYVRAWAEKYKNDGLVVIGVHTPEFAFEKDTNNVKGALKDFGITYPVVIDNEYKIWKAFGNHSWPAHYFVDRQGRIRHHHFGEGEYDESESVIRKLLTENGEKLQDHPVAVQAVGMQAASQPEIDQTPETYVGYARAERVASQPKLERDQMTEYKAVRKLQVDQWALEGKWIVSKENATLKQAGGKIRFRFRARDLHLVLGTSGVHFKVTLDGAPPGESHGDDINAAGFGEVTSHRLYQLIRQKAGKPIQEHLFEIEFLEPDVQVYAFTFG